MKDDANLICPLCYEDPFSLWPIINLQRDLTDLRDVTWKSPISSTYITIDKLPLRFLRSDANLFKDTEHSFRWFLAAYVSLYLITADSLEAYKTAKVPLKKWIDQNASQKRTPWMVIYCATAVKNVPVETCNKIYSRLSNDFYIDRPGDRTVMLITKPEATMQVQNKPRESRFLGSPESSFSTSLMLSISSFSTSSMSSISSQAGGDSQLALTSFQELLSKLREGVVQSFQYRTAAYDADIRRLEAARSSAANYDFRQLFLVKESLALMYQMMQLADKALVQYEELEDLIHSVSNSNITASNIHNNNHNSNLEKPNKVSNFQLPDTDWPMVAPELLSTADLPSTSKVPSKAQPDVPPTFSSPPMHPQANPIGTEEKDRDKDKDRDIKNDPSRNLMSDACKNGDDVLSYSINVARLKILKNKMSSLELLRYIFARQMHLLGQLERPVACAEKSMRFIHFSFTYIMKRLQEKYFVANKPTVQMMQPSPSSEVSTNPNPPEAASYELRTSQCHLWSLSASIKLLKVCRELILRLYRDGADKGLRESVAGQDKSNLFVPSSSFSSSSSAVTAAIMSAVDNEHISTNAASLVAPPAEAGSSRSSDDAVFLVQQFGNLPQPLKDSSAALSELLSFAMHCLHKLCPTLLDCKRLSSDFTIPSVQSPDTHDGLRIRVTKSGITAECVELTVPVLDEGVHQMRSNEFRLFLDHDLYLSGLGPHIVNMDQVLSFAAHKVRSLSHFWAKLRLSSGSSLRKTAADFPLDPGYVSSRSTDGEFLLPMINVGVDQVGKIALSRYDKGRALELSLAILLTSVNAEMMTWADRSRSTACLQIKVCDYLLSGGLYGRVLSLYEKGGPELVEQVVERESISLGLPIIVKFSHSAVDSINPISVQRNVPSFCLPFLRFANLGRIETGLLAGGVGFGWWAELCFWQLSKLLYCASQLKAWDILRQISAFLLTMIDDVQLRTSKDIVKGFLFSQLLLLSPIEASCIDSLDVISALHRNLSMPTLKSTEILQFPSILKELATSFRNPFSLLVLPLRKYFSFEIVTNIDNSIVQPELSSGSPSLGRLRLAAGKIKLAGLEEDEDDAEYSYDVRTFRFKAGESKSYSLYLSLVSLLPAPFSAEDITVTYSNLLNLEFHVDTSTQLPDIVVRSCSTESPEVIIRPGKQKIPLSFHSELAGDYYLNRITICRGTQCFVFQQQLPELSSAYEKEGNTSEDPSPAYAFADSGGQHRARGAGFSNYSFLHRLGSYPFLKVHSPDNPLSLRGFYPRLSPLGGEDCMLLCLDTHDEDTVSDLTIDAYVKANSSITSSSSELQPDVSPVRYQQLTVKSIDPLEDDIKRIKADIFPTVQPSNRYLSPAVREKRESLRLKQAFHQNRVRFQCGELQVRYSSPELSFDDAVPMLSLSPHDVALASVNESNMQTVSSFRYAVSNLLSGRTAQLNLKFQTYKSCADREDQDGDDEEDEDEDDEKMQFTVFLNITGLLQRRGCMYRFQQTCSCEILCLHAIKVAVVNADTDMASYDGGHFLQSVVHNQSGMQIRLVGYAFYPQVTKDTTAASSLTVSEGPPFMQNMSHLVVSDLLRSSSGFNSVRKEEGVLLSAARDEDYFAAFLVHEARTTTTTTTTTTTAAETNRSLWDLCILYEFCDDQELDKKVSAPRRFFQAKASLYTPGTVSRSHEDDIQLDFLSLFILPDKSASSTVGTSTTTSTITQLNVSVGSSIFVSYTLRLRVRQSPSLLHLHVQEESDERNSRMIVTATVCQTSSLVVIGHYRHNLTDSIKRQLSTSSPTSSKCNDVEVSLSLCLLPAKAGLLQLPPLRIQAYYQHGSGRKGKEVSFMCHPNLVGRGLHSLCAVGEHESINQFICVSIPT